MAVACVALVGLFCIATPPGSTTIKMNTLGLEGTATVDTPAWHGDIRLFTDTMGHPGRDSMQQACSGEDCVAYARQCEPLRCTFRFAEVAPGVNTLFDRGVRIVVSAADETALQAALGQIGVLTKVGDRQSAVLLSGLKP